MQNLVDLSRKLTSGAVKSSALVDSCLTLIEDEAGEGKHAFLTVYAARARHEAEQADAARARGYSLPQFAGVPISIKDLFDVQGETTRAGSRVFEDRPPAVCDAPVVQRLRRAGFVILGKTNMTEFAYSGLGINEHFGTPLNPHQREQGRIPGGSTSGGAVSVADEMAAAAIGTDTGGSCRIPAAFCGVVGFKPTSFRVPRAGAVPLSKSLDSIGPLGRSVSCCAVLDSILSGEGAGDVESFPQIGLRAGVLEGYTSEKLDTHVTAAFEAALKRLSQKGVQLRPLGLKELNDLPKINGKGGLVGAEAYAFHQEFLETRGDDYGPWLRARFSAGQAQSAADYIEVLEKRAEMQAAVAQKAQPFDVLILPTVQIAPPLIEDLKNPETSNPVNLLILRNTAVGNFLDRPCISIPCHEPGSEPVGFMLMGRHGEDRELLSIARGLEYVIRPSGH